MQASARLRWSSVTNLKVSHKKRLCIGGNLHTFLWTAALQNGSFWLIIKTLKPVCRKWLVCTRWQETNCRKSALCLGKTLRWKPPSHKMIEIRSCETFCNEKPLPWKKKNPKHAYFFLIIIIAARINLTIIIIQIFTYTESTKHHFSLVYLLSWFLIFIPDLSIHRTPQSGQWWNVNWKMDVFLTWFVRLNPLNWCD